ncbi:3-oxoacyl-ACP reductase [Haloechinothrix sp. YIM 98757]|uniref:3-oxoacyl-ACP reductase n=1 Tax=Haloechinothrix aidingensis TaxID=2752311 RepID=A0A837ZTR0_9PSEU|nr:3-oxoacyl-ACP reductase [Haloechinothrix aidingensis]MBA0123956.1 3-oxoacyl-ACP reductase [Haloechinothrix aidingensis]
MADRYQQFTNSPVGKFVVGKLGLPSPTPLRRYQPGQPLLEGPALVGAAPGGRLEKTVTEQLRGAGVEIATSATAGSSYSALVFDATGISDPKQLRELHSFFQSTIKQVGTCGRVVVLGTPPEQAKSTRERVAQRGLEGFTRSVAKELRNGATAQLVYVAPGSEGATESTLRFVLSAKSAFVDGQVIRVGTAGAGGATGTTPADWDKPLDGKVALVTGASRGIGASIAEVLARDGAHVVAVDVPAQGADLSAVANAVGGSALQLDVTAEDTPAKLVEYFAERHDGLDIVVHNAGITRDKKLANMDSARWDSVISVNIDSQLAINDALLESSVLRDNARFIGVSSIAGIAGNLGQTNYGTSKAAVIGMVEGTAPAVAERGATFNAVAPGFIETRMTAAIPVTIREPARRLSTLAQGGLPVDVAETIAWYANPASAAVNGNVVRVCGQAMIGA